MEQDGRGCGMSMFVITDNLLQEKRGVARVPIAPPLLVAPDSPWYEAVKGSVEFLLAITLLILSAPLIALAMILIKLTSPGPAIYTQTRIGKGGRPFTIYN